MVYKYLNMYIYEVFIFLLFFFFLLVTSLTALVNAHYLLMNSALIHFNMYK